VSQFSAPIFAPLWFMRIMLTSSHLLAGTLRQAALEEPEFHLSDAEVRFVDCFASAH
jgi:hypothetical protein